MTRLEAFCELKTHAWLGRVFAKLSEEEIIIAFEFLREHCQLNKGEFEQKIHRMFLDKQKPKHHTQIMELLACANSSQNIPK